eukprot:CAMPEP_0185027558 /NCGR_PEP_ID=MMETSP1103-20130426/12819_1 /TAXON_ID=36769 /ORGANISM="Paraphysomonas bandaiensis, Strain Caron Lab Isolate" /LENGTH=235 /DNA_ID=CAMNT_0027561633 /DNA_START=40 /DNA_END=744 /DNA_ORIENTATION=+
MDTGAAVISIEEYNILKRTYDDYVESSKELEVELESALEDVTKKLDDRNEQYSNAVKTIAALNDKLTAAAGENSRLSEKIIKLSDTVHDLEKQKTQLEQKNDSLEEQVRILQHSEADLVSKLEVVEEEKIFLMCEMEERIAQSIHDNQESRLKQELTELQAELARMDSELSAYRQRDVHGDSDSTVDPAVDATWMTTSSADSDECCAQPEGSKDASKYSLNDSCSTREHLPVEKW